MLQEFQGNIWEVQDKFNWIGVTTNSTVRNIDGVKQNVMGGGIALEAKKRFGMFPIMVAKHLDRRGNIPYIVPSKNIFTFPTKHEVSKDSDMKLIIKSFQRLSDVIDMLPFGINWHIPRPGCGLGGLEWDGPEGVGQYMDSLNKHKNVYFWSY
jgi:hypothetical protein